MSLMSTYFAITHAHWVRCFVKRVWNSNSNSTIFTNDNTTLND